MRVFFYVQNLLGIGHIFRALRISRALTRAGFDLQLVFGGVPPSGLDTTGLNIVLLPAIRAGAGGFGDLVLADGQPLNDAAKASRCDALLSACRAAQPDVVLIEAFPFGRRQMRFELKPLLEEIAATRPRPLVVCSVRDILQQDSKPGRAEEVVATLRRHFDHVIVHGDPSLVRLEATFPLAGAIAVMTSYSGIVAPDQPAPPPPAATGARAVVISAGGGAVGGSVLRAALQAKPRTKLSDRRWLAITGTNMADAEAREIAELATRQGVELARFVPDLISVLRTAELSISQAGYNTVADVLRAGARAVLVPFAAGGETEQTRRAALLAARGCAVMLSEADLDTHSMIGAIESARCLPPPSMSLDLEGAAATAVILRGLMEKRSTRDHTPTD